MLWSLRAPGDLASVGGWCWAASGADWWMIRLLNGTSCSLRSSKSSSFIVESAAVTACFPLFIWNPNSQMQLNHHSDGLQRVAGLFFWSQEKISIGSFELHDYFSRTNYRNDDLINDWCKLSEHKFTHAESCHWNQGWRALIRESEVKCQSCCCHIPSVMYGGIQIKTAFISQ